MLFTVLLSFEDPLYVPDESSAKYMVYPSQSSAFSAPSQVLLHLPLAVHVQLTDSTVALWLKSTLGSDVCTLRRCPLPPPASNQSMSVYMQGWAEIHNLSLGNTAVAARAKSSCATLTLTLEGYTLFQGYLGHHHCTFRES